ncbi:KTSC domain-containing protein [Ferribacterium limneticum]|uniref:KTSC domain-containing protein n=1 Tax=Ferribacterium limneticum TaxID=76259 RepID=UPI001CF85BEB|nr:KTSC domain-containing protein [Ferribacterium limneticum]UCV26731.1 KTSC domain-containing protein [Ferribacterium limneticum]UCV30648.1 KTSC domain-containing protein [Ferribacterium limneticum]
MKISTNHVISSNINRIGYNGTTLYIGFNSGQPYSYVSVPYQLFLEMLKAESVGSFFHNRIRKVFSYTKLDSDPFDEPARAPAVSE